jgi:hypothetical protein
MIFLSIVISVVIEESRKSALWQPGQAQRNKKTHYTTVWKGNETSRLK